MPHIPAYVFCVPNLRENLMSVPNLARKRECVIFDNGGAVIYEKNTGELIAKWAFEDSTYKIKFVI